MKVQPIQGFTLIELTVVLLLVSILTAIAIPGFLNQVTKAKHSEAQMLLSTANRLQQAHYTEFGEFADNIESLGLVVPDSPYYAYAVVVSPKLFDMQATPKSGELRGFRGCVWIVVRPDDRVEDDSTLLEGEKGQDAAPCPNL